MSLTPDRVNRALTLSIYEGAAWAVMVGLGETYFVADAVRLGASPLQLALIVTLPLALAGVGPLLALSLLGRGTRRRPIAITYALLQMLVLATLAVLEWRGMNGPHALIALACVYQITGQGAGTAWSSWIADLVPTDIRGRYFARRNRGIYVSTCGGLVLGGLLLQRLEPASAGMAAAGAALGHGYAVTFTLAAIFRLVSAYLLLRTPEPEFAGLADRAYAVRFLGSDRGRQAMKLLSVAAVFHFAVYLSAPYFGPFMLETLRFTYLQYMSASIFVVVCKAVSTLWWGRAVDRFGARRIFILAVLLVGTVPLPWVVADGLWVVWLAQGLSGASWSAYELGFFTLLLESSTRRTRPAIFAAQSLLAGWAQLGGGALGASLLPGLGGKYVALFGLSAACRLLVGLFIPLVVRPAAPLTPVRGWWPALRTLGFRPGGGLSRRPVFDPTEEGALEPDERQG